MKLPTKLVAVKRISSSVARSNFPSDQIEKAAHLINDVEGTINPVILRRTGLDSFEVVDGQFEYHAAVRAREISPLKSEVIQAIILNVENEKVIREQVNLFRKNVNRKPVINEDKHDFESILIKLENDFKSQFFELRKENNDLKQAIFELASKIQSSSFVGTELVDEIVKRVVEAIPASTISSRTQEKNINELSQSPLNLNSASEGELRSVPNIGKKRASHIVNRRMEKGDFTRIEELSEIKGISNNTIRKYQWHKCFVI